MTEITGKYEVEESTENARAMIGMPEEPSLEIEAPRKVTIRRGGQLHEEDRPAFVKIYTNFKGELKDLPGLDLKVWLYLALSVNRFTGDARPGLRKIADDLNISVNTARLAIERLEEKELLDVVEGGDGKRNIYRPSDYVSAKKETVSKTDTVSQTVSDLKETVSVSKKTVSTQYRKSAQPEEPDIKPERERKSLDFKNMTIPQARRVPTLKMYADATGWFPADVLWEKVHITILENDLTAEKLQAAAEAWVGRGYKRGNVMGILDWAIHGVPEGKGGTQPVTQTQPIDKFAALIDYVDRQEAGS